MSKHQFEIIEEDETTIIPDRRQSSQEDTLQERIRLSAGNWILRNRISGEQGDTLPFEDARGKKKLKKILLHLIANKHRHMKKSMYFKTNKTLVEMITHHLMPNPHKMPTNVQHHIV